jgi:hypothetical protein
MNTVIETHNLSKEYVEMPSLLGRIKGREPRTIAAVDS